MKSALWDNHDNPQNSFNFVYEFYKDNCNEFI